MCLLKALSLWGNNKNNKKMDFIKIQFKVFTFESTLPFHFEDSKKNVCFP